MLGGALEALATYASRDGTSNVVVCERCAAISIWDGTKSRCLRTEEWLSLVCDPRWYDVIEERVAVMDRLTDPAPERDDQ